MSIKHKSPEFKLGVLWMARKIWNLLPIKDDEPNAYLVYHLKKIQDALEDKNVH